MPISCVAYGCTNRQQKKTDVNSQKLHFHRFPWKRPEILKKWIIAVRRKDWTPTKYSFICSEHFSETCYMFGTDRNKPLLKDDAVPEIFNFPNHLLQPPKKRRRIIQRQVPVEDQKQCTNSASNLCAEENHVACDSLPKLPKPPDSPKKVALKKKIKLLQEKLRRRNKKISNMKLLLKELKSTNSSNSVISVLESRFEGFPLEVLMNAFTNEGNAKHRWLYTSLMKQFASTLYFYSPKAFRFVRSKFHDLFHLPHPSTIRAWISKLNCEPGYLEEVFLYLKGNIDEKPWLKDCNLVIDAISLRTQTVWDRAEGKYSGYVDCGEILGSEDELASEALVLMLVSLTHNFKCPVGYFLINKTSAEIQCQMINVCLTKLHEVGVKVWGLTCDGTSTNVQTIKQLGCTIDLTVNSCSFEHVKMGIVFLIFDPCHMVKLARNTLSDEKIISSSKGDIKWEYIAKLNEIQENEGLNFANNLSGAHIRWGNKKMNVQLAVQTLSSGVADAISFLRKQGHPFFADSEATEEFIYMIDRLFDLLNSRNPFQKGYKQPLFIQGEQYWVKFFTETCDYLRSLKIEGVPLLCHARKMFCVGFIIAATSISLVARILLTRAQNPFKYVLTYKFSQDHIELFFSCIRARGGWNNNPNTLQFKWALRRLLIRNSVTAAGNCLNIDSVQLGSVFEFRSQKRTVSNVCNESNDTGIEEEYSDLLCMQLSEFQDNILCYIGGYIVMRLLKSLTCSRCRAMVIRQTESFPDHSYAVPHKTCYSFVQHVLRGKLIEPSPDVLRIIQCTEKEFRLRVVLGEQMNASNLDKIIVQSVVMKLSTGGNLPFHFSHPVDSEYLCEELHELQILRKIAEIYLLIRLVSYGKKQTLYKAHGNSSSVRAKLNKLIMFSHV